MPGHTRLFRRNGTYYLRVKVPEKLRGILGKREIQESLRTRDYREAVKLVKPRSMRVDLEFDRARAKLARQNGQTEKPPLQLSEADIFAIVCDCFIKEERRNESWMAVARDTLSGEQAEEIALNLRADAVPALPNEDALPSYCEAKQLLSEYLQEAAEHWQIDERSESYQKLIRLAQRAFAEANLRQADRIEKNGRFQRRDETFAHATAHSNAPAVKAVKQMTLGEFLDSYEAHQKAANAVSTLKAIAMPMRVLREVLGKKMMLGSITKDHMTKVADVLRAIPQNMAQRYPGLSLGDAIAAAERDGKPKRHPTTLANNWNHIASVFQFAKDDGLIDENPAQSKRFRAAFHKSKKSSRMPFTSDQLGKIFHAPLFTKRGVGGEIVSRDAKPELFWLPLLGLFEGCRLNELCQMETADVQEEGGIPFLFIHTLSESGEASRKRLKTKESRRKVPLHPAILEIGFSQYVEKRRNDESNPRLFPSLPFDKSTGRFSSAFSKRFSRFVRKVCGKNTTATFHSFRHNFRDAMRNAAIQEETAARLGGWQAAGGVMNFYGEGFSLPQLREAIAKVQYPGLDLCHLIINTAGHQMC